MYHVIPIDDLSEICLNINVSSRDKKNFIVGMV